MKKLLLILISALLLCLFSCSKATKKIELSNMNSSDYVFVASVYPPFAYVNSDGKADGSDVAIIKRAAEKAKINVSFKFMKWDRAVKRSEFGIADGIFTFSKTSKREKNYYFPRVSISLDEMGIFANNNYKSSVEKISDLRGQKVGVIEGYIYPKEFKEYSNCKKIVAKDEQQLFEWLIKGRYDLAISGIKAGQYFLDYEKTHRFKNFKAVIDRIKLMPILLQVDPLFIAFSKKSDAGLELVKKFDKALLEMRNSGEMYRISQEYK